MGTQARLLSEAASAKADPQRSSASEGSVSELARLLHQWFGCDFTVIDAERRQIVLEADDQPSHDWETWCELAAAVAERREPDWLAEEGPLATLALPVTGLDDDLPAVVAVATFAIRALQPDESLLAAGQLLGLDRPALGVWLADRTPIAASVLMRTAQAFSMYWQARQRLVQAEVEVEQVSEQISGAYEEISLLHRLTAKLRLTCDEEALARVALNGLSEVLAAEGMAVRLTTRPDDPAESSAQRGQARWLAHGTCPIDLVELDAHIERLQISPEGRPLVLNRSFTDRREELPEEIDQLIVVPIAEGPRCFGWMVAMNSTLGREFGTHEAQLVGSVATLLGIHYGNTELYRQQQELLTGVIRALSSAIDAKDPYTCGHSDRVARVAVRLAQDLGIEGAALQNIYMTGLLHDIGKIGIDDQVLRKPGRLTQAEFEHIKTHAELGYNILVDLKALGAILPGVRHHHEAWDGSGYPHGLVGEQIPLLARIIAVADSYDAMGSDRPYRKGMEDERLDEIFRQGAGKQWDPDIVGAFFRVRNDIHHIAHNDSCGYDAEVPQWVERHAYRPVRRGE